MTTTFLSLGNQIRTQADALQVVSLATVADQVRSDERLQHLTQRLRKLVTFDRDAYRTAKVSLPYVVGSLFGEGGRRLDALLSAHYFILDLDHCTDLNGTVPDEIRADLSVALAFVSPSGEGLKLFFRLLEPCTDARLFAQAYRNFAGDFAARHGFVRSIDLCTSDATRACFLAHDPTAFHNEQAMPVDWRLWVGEDAAFTDAGCQAPTGDATPGRPIARKPADKRPIDEDRYKQVLRTLNPTLPARREKSYFVPGELSELAPALQPVCTQLGWEPAELTPISYGLKVAVKHGFRRAEVNVFYGKRGFSIVRSPKTGTDAALAELLYQQLYWLLFPEPVADAEVLAGVKLSMN